MKLVSDPSFPSCCHAALLFGGAVDLDGGAFEAPLAMPVLLYTSGEHSAMD